MDDSVELIVWLVAAAIAWLFQYLKKRSQKDEPQAPEWVEDLEAAAQAQAPPPYPGAVEPQPYPEPPPTAGEPDPWRERLEALVVEASEVARDARVDWATTRFSDVIDHHVVLPGRLLLSHAQPPEVMRTAVASLDVIFGQIEVFIRQRRDPVGLARLGDADALATSCYEPLMKFAQAENMGLSSSTPVTQLGPFDLGIWTGFLPTGLAPIFLPSDFFARIAWWPALAHEIGHDFLAATRDADEKLREQLGIVPEELGVQPVYMGQAGIPMQEIERVFGAWFEELFCDFVGTLMVGPAYGYSMLELFASPADPAVIAHVRVSRAGRTYDTHPPRQLRFVLCLRALEMIGCKDDAERLREMWTALHGEIRAILYPTMAGTIGIAPDILYQLVGQLAELLYNEQLTAFAGYRLRDIPGVDFGPHEAADMSRVERDLLAGRVPAITKARAVVAGAVLATHKAPEREARIMALARRAIPAEGTAEHGRDAYALPGDRLPGESAPETGVEAAREAFLLHTILSRPPGLRHCGLGVQRDGFLSRPV